MKYGWTRAAGAGEGRMGGQVPRPRVMSLLDCPVTIPGGGNGRNGHPKKAVTKPMKELIVDNGFIYNKVYGHVAGYGKTPGCTKCDPVQILEIYLRRRMSPTSGRKDVGMTSTGLARLAIKYENLLRKRGVDATVLINEFLWRAGAHSVVEHAARLTPWECFQGIHLTMRQFASSGGPLLPHLKNAPPLVIELAKLAETVGQTDVHPDELERLCHVAGVMAT